MGADGFETSTENIIVAMMHVNKTGKNLKMQSTCQQGVGCVKRVVTRACSTRSYLGLGLSF
jgi:acyl CoA:acetate/3-ketoacid CoA transferase beta subunit